MKSIFCLMTCSLLGISAIGQHQDLRLWTSLSVRYDLSKKWRLTLEEEARIFENMGRLDKINSELTIDYQFSKVVSAGLLYRNIFRNNGEDDFPFNHRFSVFAEVQKTFGGWTPFLESTYQKTYKALTDRIEGWNIPEDYLRLKAGLSREWKKWDIEPYADIEFWYLTSVGKISLFDQYRLTAGIKHKLSRNHRIDLFYCLQQEVQVKDPLTAHILGIGYRYTIR